MRTKRPFFIVGSPRSGTTLLQTMFMTLPGIYIPPETKFLGITRDLQDILGPISTVSGLKNLITATLKRCTRMEIPCDPETLAAELRNAEPNYGDLFDTFLSHIQAQRPGCRRIGEKSPDHMRCVPDLLDMFPDCSVITIIRDGRDSAVSQMEAFPRRTLIGIARGWRNAQRQHARYSSTLPSDRYASVRYEDLVSNPERELRRLCAFLDETFDDAMLRPHERAEQGFAKHEVHKHRTRDPVTTSRISRYQQKMSRSDIALFQYIAGRELTANNYQLEKVPTVLVISATLHMIPKLVKARLHYKKLRRAAARNYAPNSQTDT